MIKHIVMWRLESSKNGLNKAEAAAEIRKRLESLPEKIDEIIDFEVGDNFNPAPVAYDICLYSTFEDCDALQAYQVHPAHVEVKNFIVATVAETVVVDYRC
jgi:hypothetical protein